MCRGPSRQIHKVIEGLIDDMQLGAQSREAMCKTDLYPKADM